MAEPLFDVQHPLENYLSESLHDVFRPEMPGKLEDIPEPASGVGMEVPDKEWRDDHFKKAARYVVNGSAIAISFLSSLYITPPGDRRPSKPKHIVLAQQFAERFKYVTISSSLLDSSNTPSSALPDFSMLASSTLPGSSPTASPSGIPSLSDGMLEFSLDSDQEEPTVPPSVQPSPSKISQLLTHRSATASAVAVALYLNGYTVLFTLALVVLAFKFFASDDDSKRAASTCDARQAYEKEQVQIARSSYMMTLEALDTLVLAGNVWNAVVNEAISTLELEERRIFYGPTSALSPGSSTTSLRVALHSTLSTSQSQSDNVRQLFGPLTSSRQLPQLSEMYAPPNPVKMKALGSLQQQINSKLGHGRPMSLSLGPSMSRSQISATDDGLSQSSKADKRSTWSAGTKQVHLGPAGLGTNFLMRREKKLRSGLSLAISKEEEDGDAQGCGESSFAETTLVELDGQPESSLEHQSFDLSVNDKQSPKYSPGQLTAPSSSFTMSRSRRSPSSARHYEHTQSMSAPASAMLSGQPSSSKTSPCSVTMTPSPSRLTLVQTTRHPLSLSALHRAIQTAIGSKRYAAAHLLALRFGDEDDKDDEEEFGMRSKRSSISAQGDLRRRSLKGPSHSRKTSYASSIFDFTERVDYLDWEFDLDYWEDVRSVMSLLTSALEDAAQRLVDAMEENDRERTREVPASPLPPTPAAAQSSHSLSAPTTSHPLLSPLRASSLRRKATTTGSSFAPMPSTLTRLATHIHAIAAALDEAREHLADCASYASENGSSERSSTPTTSAEMALQSFESLRKELGFALRECERTRAPLMEAFQNQPPTEVDGEDDDDEEDLPALAHDQSSNEDLDSDPQDREIAMPPVHDKMYIGPPDPQDVEEVDATAQHLLLTSSPSHLPPVGGLEQVFESVGGGGFNRPKTQMTREERIALVKAKRASLGPGIKTSLVPSTEGIGRSASSPGNELGRSDNAWGPGGEVVQELKDVIHRVGERRKRLANERDVMSPVPDVRPRSMVDLSELITASNRQLLPSPTTFAELKYAPQHPSTVSPQTDSPTDPEFSELEIPMGIAM